MPIFDVMQQKGWKPEVVLVPKGLSLDTWNTLLTGHRLPDGKLSEGLAYPENILDNPEPVSDETDRWEVVVISAGSRPPIREVRPDGANDKYTQKMNALIADLLDKTKSSSLPTVRRFSPSREAYLALQLTQFARHKPPVDAIYGGSQTIAKELHEELYAWRLGWDEFSNRITCNFYRIDATTEDVGLRPTIMEQELELKLI